MCKSYQKKFQAEYMSSDHKPKGKVKRYIEGSNRMRAKQEIRCELDNLEEIRDNTNESKEG